MNRLYNEKSIIDVEPGLCMGGVPWGSPGSFGGDGFGMGIEYDVTAGPIDHSIGDDPPLGGSDFIDGWGIGGTHEGIGQDDDMDKFIDSDPGV